MRWRTQSCILLIAAALLLSACGKDNGSPPAVCAQTGNMTLYASGTGTTLLTSITVTAAQNAAVPAVPVWVGYASPPVAVILAGYPRDGVDPLTMGIDIVPNLVTIGTGTSNPLQLSVTFNTARSPATYNAVLRFVATDMADSESLGCQDVPVTFTVN